MFPTNGSETAARSVGKTKKQPGGEVARPTKTGADSPSPAGPEPTTTHSTAIPQLWKEPLTIALIYDFDGTLAPGNMQEYDFIPAVGKSNKEFWHDANQLAEEQDADMVLTYMARMIQEAQSKGPVAATRSVQDRAAA